MAAKNETGLIERIRKALPSRAGAHRRGEVRLGMGDDAAVLRPRPGRELVISTDQFLEGAHFLVRLHSADSVGYKALARATSDLAAMGAAPRYFFLSLALPVARTGAWLDDFLRGMARAARQFNMVLLGGDLAKQRSIAVTITVMGESVPGEAVTRSGARPGDAIFVSGRLGTAALGLKLFLRSTVADRKRQSRAATRQSAMAAHLYPLPRIALGVWLARKRVVSAMIDLSDGFSTDLGHICAASGVGARVHAAALPCVRIPRGAPFACWRLDPLELALHGGEDYELVFTVPARLAAKIPARFDGLKLTRVGEITRHRAVLLEDSRGRTRVLRPRGWDHFR